MNKDIYRTLLALLALAFTACVNEVDAPPSEGGGRLQLSLANISTATTRTTPRDIGAPLASDLHLTITNVIGRAVYDDVFTEDVITLPTGRYDVVVSYGRNALMAIDAPYYIGTDNVEIKKDETTEASITASVGNALVSVKFGNDAEETARFERFYSDYALQVFVDNYYMSISKDEPGKSIYVQAGSHVNLRFWGKLKMEDDREVSTVLESKDLPDVLNAADHAIVTLSLPDPESALGVDISKVEVETVTLDETIPLSWLPVPQATPSHHYDEQGNLVGTDLTFSNSYPGMTWMAEVTKTGSTEILRTKDGTGDLTSAYTDSEEWPYLPSGSYTAKFYLQMNGTLSQTSSRTFTIQKPENLKITVDAFTSYTKYLEEEVEKANEAGPNGEVGFYGRKIRNVSARLMVADNIINNAKYAALKSNVTAAVDGTALSGTATGQTFFLANTGDLSRAQHTLSVSGTFDGGTATNKKVLEVTGIPYLADSETAFNEWAPGGDYSMWADDTPSTQEGEGAGTCYYFRGDLKASGEAYLNIYTPRFYTPSEMKIRTIFDLWIYGASAGVPYVGTTEMLYCKYGPVPSTSATPDAASKTFEHQVWTKVENSRFALSNSTPYLSWQWHHDYFKDPVFGSSWYGYYWWGINNVKVLYREKE